MIKQEINNEMQICNELIANDKIYGTGMHTWYFNSSISAYHMGKKSVFSLFYSMKMGFKPHLTIFAQTFRTKKSRNRKHEKIPVYLYIYFGHNNGISNVFIPKIGIVKVTPFSFMCYGE